MNPRVKEAEAQPRLLSEDLTPVKAEGKEFNVLMLSYTRELSRPFKENNLKDKQPLVKSKTSRSAARPPMLGWRCALVRILVFSFHLLSSSRR